MHRGWSFDFLENSSSQTGSAARMTSKTIQTVFPFICAFSKLFAIFEIMPSIPTPRCVCPLWPWTVPVFLAFALLISKVMSFLNLPLIETHSDTNNSCVLNGLFSLNCQKWQSFCQTNIFFGVRHSPQKICEVLETFYNLLSLSINYEFYLLIIFNISFHIVLI